MPKSKKAVQGYIDISAGYPTQEHVLMDSDAELTAAAEYEGYKALVDRTVDVFGDELIASRWLSMPSADFDGKVPIFVAEQLNYVPGKVEKVFEPIFIRIEHGIDA